MAKRGKKGFGIRLPLIGRVSGVLILVVLAGVAYWKNLFGFKDKITALFKKKDSTT